MKSRTKLMTVCCLAAAVLLSGCRSPDAEAPRRHLSGIDAPHEPVGTDRGPPEVYQDPVAKLVHQLEQDLRLTLTPGQKLGCLPFVSFDPQNPAGWVSELGVQIADDLARRLAGHDNEVLNTVEMAMRVARAGGDLAYDGHGIQQAELLGQEVLVFGTIQHRDHAVSRGPGALRSLQLRGVALDVASGRLLADASAEITNEYPQSLPLWEASRLPSVAWRLDGPIASEPARTGEAQVRPGRP